MIGDTIVATASPPGAGARGVIRISGGAAVPVAGALLDGELPRVRAVRSERLRVLGESIAALVLVMPAPGSYTGEDVVELHLPGSPLLLATVSAALERAAPANAAVRAALPGEFTRRAYQHGRLDLVAAEGVLELIHAATEDERRRAWNLLSGGLASAVDGVRGELQDALAALESGLDFGADETGAVPREAWLPIVERCARGLAELEERLPVARAGGQVLLLGAANAGKSSLCNALAGREEVLVAAAHGTTRDVLRVEVGAGLVLLDAPGDLVAHRPVDRSALELRDRLAGNAGAVLLVIDATDPVIPRTELRVLAAVWTKCDLVAEAVPPDGWPGLPSFVVSSLTGQGLPELKAFLELRAAAGPDSRGSRVGEILARARAAVARAVGCPGERIPEEMVAADLGEALVLLDAIHGRSTPEDLLDRIFARFCLGK